MSDLKVTSGVANLMVSSSATSNNKAGKLHEAAQSFEALMIGQMMKSVRESSESGWLGSSGDDSSTESAVEMAEQHFAKALAQGGGLGLAKMVEQSVGKQGGVTSSE